MEARLNPLRTGTIPLGHINDNAEAVFVATLLVWTRNNSVGQERTRTFLRNELR